MNLGINKRNAMALANVPVNHYNVHAVVNAVFEWWLVEHGYSHSPRVDCSCRRCSRLLEIAHVVITMDKREAPIVLIPFIEEVREQRWACRPIALGHSDEILRYDSPSPWIENVTRALEDIRTGEA